MSAINNNQFEMYLQPKVNPMTRLVSGAEASIRWNHPKYGLMLPETFLPSLEHKNLVTQLDLYLCQQVCNLLKNWQAEGTQPTQISVNFSRLGITQPKVLASYEKLLEDAGDIVQFLEFEFTESAAYDDFTQLHDVLAKIHSYGALCCMDDFGSSYSNLNAIRQLSFDSVKLSRSFFENGFPAEERSRELKRSANEYCEDALRQVALWDFVNGFPEGMDHCIGEGGNSLSGGQKQRLCIARAMVKKADLVLLDEATSALDFQTEREVQEALDKLLAGRSAVIIAHRLSTVQNADYVYCMDRGRVAEEGTPEELLAKKGMYYEMYRMQSVHGMKIC